MMRTATAFCSDENGAALVEYALVVSLIALACVVAVSLFGSEVAAFFSNAAGSI